MSTAAERYQEGVLLGLIHTQGGQANPDRFFVRSPDAPSRKTFERLVQQGCLTSTGVMTDTGRRRLSE